ncbi:MAG: two-component regulator propeller domain-containing protein [Terriglobales bacterium]
MLNSLVIEGSALLNGTIVSGCELKKMASRRPLLLRFSPLRTIARSQLRSCVCVLLLASAVSLLANFSIAPVHAQSTPTQYVTRVWHTEEGLPQNSVNAMLQDHRGYIWIGTFGGLARFDGERFTVFDSANTPGFGSDQISSLYESRSGALWIGTVDGGLIRLQDGVATTYTERDGLPNRWVTSIRGDLEGNVWINTAAGGVAHFAGTKLEAYPTHRGKAVREFFLQARDGSRWFRCGQDVVRFAADGSIATLRSTQPSVFFVHEARDGSVWVAFRDQYRLVRYYRGVFSDVPLPSVKRRELTSDLLLYSFAMTEEADGELLLRTPAGLVRIVDGTVSPPEALPLPTNAGELLKVRSLLVDREGNLWFGTIGRGLIRLRRAPLTAYGKDEGLSDSNFSSVFQDREGRIWLGGDLLYRFDGHRFHQVPGVADVLAIAQTRDGDLWFGGYGGLYRLRSGVLSHFNVNAPAVKIIFQDREGTLWIGALTEDRPGGLYRFREGKLEQVPGISDVRAISEDRDGGLWLGGLAGLRYMRGSEIMTYDRKQGLSSNSVYDIHQDSTGTLWVATYGGGLNRFRDGRFWAITTQDGLPDNLLLGLLEDGEDNLWFSSNQSVFRLSLKELNDFADGKISFLSPVSYGAAEGMRSTESNGGSPGGWITRDGRIWFPTLRGVVAIDPTAGNRFPPPVVLEEAWANKLPLAGKGRTSVPPGNNTFDFRFTALSFSAPEKLHFKYRLEPFDKDWVDARTHHTAHYTNMDPGEYSFHVLAANNFGIWSDQEASVRFALQPYFYQTNWFRALCAASILILLWCGYQLRVRQLAHQFNMRLEERVSERTRIARDLHDTLLQSFQGLVFRFQAARYHLPDRPEEASDVLDSALVSADQAIVEGRSAIQELRSGSSEESNLEQMLLATGRELASSKKDGDSAPSLRVIVEGERRVKRAMIREEIYRIARELLRNAYRHAHAQSIEAELRYDDGAFLLVVRDDGKGIDPEVLKDHGRAGHWGLPGLYERAEGIGARLDIWSEAGAGTEVRLMVPAAIAYEKSGGGGRFKLFRKTRIYEHRS